MPFQVAGVGESTHCFLRVIMKNPERSFFIRTCLWEDPDLHLHPFLESLSRNLESVLAALCDLNAD